MNLPIEFRSQLLAGKFFSSLTVLSFLWLVAKIVHTIYSSTA